MKVSLQGRYIEDILPYFESKHFKITANNPELIVVHGGDGALLGAERDFPGIPKFPVRDIRTAPLCPEHSSYEKIFGLLRKNKLNKSEIMKISASCGAFRVKAINDIFIHNLNPVSAIRYKVFINDKPYGEEIVGDGAGVSTVHGSTAYYRSITHSIFRVGIGLAFSNSTELINHLVLPEDTSIKITLTRGPAVLVADNSPNTIELSTGNSVSIRKIQEKAVTYGLDIFMCHKCRKLRHPRE
jgi:NAD+ kinase